MLEIIQDILFLNRSLHQISCSFLSLSLSTFCIIYLYMCASLISVLKHLLAFLLFFFLLLISRNRMIFATFSPIETVRKTILFLMCFLANSKIFLFCYLISILLLPLFTVTTEILNLESYQKHTGRINQSMAKQSSLSHI